MTPDRWQRLVKIFSAVLEQAPQEREAFLDAACARDSVTRRELDSLLASLASDPEFLQSDAAGRITPPPPDEQALQGETIGPFRILRRLASGGMGEVYLAERSVGDIEQQVAVKLLPRGVPDPDLRQRFLRERNILARLEHPHICKLLDGGLTRDDRPWFAMPFLEGAESLTAHCDRRRLSLRRRVQLFLVVCDAVHAAHQNLIVHADLKPGNILVTAEGHLSLVDFGISRLLHGRGPDDPTTIMGESASRPLTPEYASPEQVRGEAPSTASDIYSLGVVLYQLLSGARPYDFRTGTPEEVLHVLSATTPRPPSAQADAPAVRGEPSLQRLRRALAGDLDNIVLKAMAAEPQRRYASAAALAEDLQRWLDGRPVQARPASLGYQTGKFVRRHAGAVAAGGTALVALIAFAVSMTVAAERVALERDRAEAVAGFLGELFEEADPVAGEAALSARDMLQRGLQRLRDDRAIGPLERAAILGTLASAYYSLGDYATAASAAEQALQSPLAAGRASRAYLAAANTLADIAIRFERGDEALAASRTVAELVEGLPDPTPAERADVLNRLAVSYRLSGNLGQAMRHADEAIAVLRRQAGAQENDDLAVHLSNFARMHYQRAGEREGAARDADLDRAEALVAESLAIFRRAFGPRHPRVAFTLNAQATLARERGRYQAAAESYRSALGIAGDTLGAEHPFVAIAAKNLGEMLVQQGQMQAALPELRRARTIAAEAYPADNPIHARLDELIDQAGGATQ